MKNLNLNKDELRRLLAVVKEQNIYSVVAFRTENMLKFIDELEQSTK